MAVSINYLITQTAARLKTPPTGGTARSSTWINVLRVGISPITEHKLERVAAEVSARSLVTVKAKDVAALILELTLEAIPMKEGGGK